MQAETLKQWEKDHPELADLFTIIIGDIDRVCKEETRKAFKAIDTRLQEEIGADCDKMGVSNDPAHDLKMNGTPNIIRSVCRR